MLSIQRQTDDSSGAHIVERGIDLDGGKKAGVELQPALASGKIAG